MFVRKSNRASHRRALMTTAAVMVGLGAAAAQAATPIDTNQPYYLQSQVGSTVTPDFKGGTLRNDQNNAVDVNNYTFESFPTNTIDAFGNKTIFTGGFSGAGPLTITDSKGGGAVIYAGGVSSISGTLTITSGATLQWGDGTGSASLLGGASGDAITDNGTLVMNLGGGGVQNALISGSGDVVIQTGSFQELGTSTYTGSTTIDANASIYMGPGGSIAASSGVTAIGNFDASGTTTSITTLSGPGTGTVNLGAKTLTLTNASGTFSGLILDGGNAGGVGGALTIAGGTEILSGGNLYTGATTINMGATLGLKGAGSIATSSGVTANGKFDISGTTAGASITTLSGSGSVNLGAQTLTLTNASGTFAGVIADGGLSGGTGGGLTIGGGTEILTGTNTYTGTTTIAGGATLQLGNGGTTGSVAGAIVDNGVLKFDYSGSVTTPGAISGTGSAEVVAGTAVVSKTSFINGPVTIDSGATLQWGDGTNAGYLAGLGATNVVNNGTLVFNEGINGIGSFLIAGSGNLIVHSGGWGEEHASTYTGSTTIDPGAHINIGGSGSISASSNVTVNGALDISNTTSGTSITTLSGSGAVDLGTQTLTLTNASGTFSGVIADTGLYSHTGGGLTIAGGTEILTGTNSYTGTTTIAGGATLQLGNGGATGSVTGNIVDNGVLKFDYSGPVTVANNISGTGSAEVVAGTAVVSKLSFVNGPVTIDSGATLQWGDGTNAGYLAGLGATNVVNNGTLVFNEGVNGIGSFLIAGSGNLIVHSGGWGEGHASTYTGSTTIDPGARINIGGSGSISASSNVTVNGILDISNTTSGTSISTLSGSGAVDLGAKTLTLTNASGTFSGVIADTGLYSHTGGGLTIAGGTEILTGTNSYTGTTTIAGGATLQLGNGGATGSVTGNIVDNGVLKFDYSGPVTTPGAISGTGSAEVVSGTAVVTSLSFINGLVTVDNGATLQWGDGTTAGYLAGLQPNNVVNNGTLVFNEGINGIGSFLIAGSGDLVVESGSWNEEHASTYTGSTTINPGGRLFISGSGSISASSNVTVNGILDISNTTSGTSITTLSGSGAVDLGAKTLTLTNASGTFAGVITDTGVYSHTGGGLTIAGGTEILSGTNTYTGPTTVNPGATLQLGAGGASGSVAGGVVDNGTLVFNRSDAYAYSGVVSGSGKLVQAGTGTLILNGVNTVSGQTTVLAGALEIGDATHTGAVLDSHLGGVSVGANGVLAGHGSILGAVTNAAGGTVAPGGTIGTLTVGSYTQGAGSTLAIEVSPTAASQLKALGQASLNGRLALTFDAGNYVPHIFTIVAGAPVTGTFSSVSASSSPADPVAYGLRYSPTQTELLVVPAAPAQVYDGVTTATLDRAQGLASLVEDRFGDAGCADGSVDKKVEACQGMGAWAQAVGTSDNLHAGGASLGFTNSSAGFLGGIDRRWGGGVTVGAAFGYEGEDLSMGGASAHATGSTYFGALYGRWVVDRAFIDGQAFYMHSDWTVNRQLTGFGAARSSPGGNTEGFLLQVSAPIHGDDLRPYVRVTYARFDRSGVTETGVGALGFAVDSATTSSTLGEAGLMFGHSYGGMDGREVRPQLQVGLQDAIGDRSRDVQVALPGLSGPGVTVASASVPKVAGVVDGSITLKLNQSFELTGDLRGRFNGEQTDASASLGGVFRF